ncbi:hypothetical protein COO60DRAFT_1509885 [Scenedesmus sp. NREL 46B-D3]|nr:hypothetical protein COO60DRAFT_1509885 [Scenedesmus sp. NREL 46B-D3]
MPAHTMTAPLLLCVWQCRGAGTIVSHYQTCFTVWLAHVGCLANAAKAELVDSARRAEPLLSVLLSMAAPSIALTKWLGHGLRTHAQDAASTEATAHMCQRIQPVVVVRVRHHDMHLNHVSCDAVDDGTVLCRQRPHRAVCCFKALPEVASDTSGGAAAAQ